MSAVILDELFEDIFGIPLLEPTINYVKQWRVVHESKKPNPKPRYNEIGERHKYKGFVEQEEVRLQWQQKMKEEERMRKHGSVISMGSYRSSQTLALKMRPFGS